MKDVIHFLEESYSGTRCDLEISDTYDGLPWYWLNPKILMPEAENCKCNV